MQKLIVAIGLLIGSIYTVLGSEKNICELEALSYEHNVEFSDVIKFLNSQKFNLHEISQPDIYVYAYNWLDTPYRYGGDSRSGIDCSRFVMRVYSEVLGIPTNGTSRQLFEQGSKVERKNLQEGDMVFFKTKGNAISHVGIYLKDDKFVHASTSKGVIVSSLNEPYWARTYYKSARLFERNPF